MLDLMTMWGIVEGAKRAKNDEPETGMAKSERE
jgi:hypothetical protein